MSDPLGVIIPLQIKALHKGKCVVYISIVQIKVGLIDFELPVHSPIATNHQRTILKTIIMRLKATTLLALCASLPLALAATIQIYVREEWKDKAIVAGKNSSHGEMATMSRATHNEPGSRGVCAGLAGRWQFDFDLLCKTKHYGVAQILFEEPTKGPRPIDVTLGTDVYNVSHNKTCHRLN